MWATLLGCILGEVRSNNSETRRGRVQERKRKVLQQLCHNVSGRRRSINNQFMGVWWKDKRWVRGSPFWGGAEASIYFSPFNGKAHQTLLEARHAGWRLIPGACCCFVLFLRPWEWTRRCGRRHDNGRCCIPHSRSWLAKRAISITSPAVRRPSASRFPRRRLTVIAFTLLSVASKEKKTMEGDGS